MPCDSAELRQIPLFSLLDNDELAVLAQQVEVREFAAKQRIYKAGDPSGAAYVALTGAVEVTLLDEDGQEVIFSQPRHGDFFGVASMLEGTAHRTTAVATEPTTCIEVDRNDISVLLEKKPCQAWTCSRPRRRDSPRSTSHQRPRHAQSQRVKRSARDLRRTHR